MKIEYNDLPELECEKNYSNIDIWFELDEKFIKWHSRYNAECSIIDNDPDSGFHEVLRSWDVTGRRDDIGGVEKVYFYGSKYWKVNIEFRGVGDKMYITIPRRKESVANMFYNLFTSYMRGASMDELQLIYDQGK